MLGHVPDPGPRVPAHAGARGLRGATRSRSAPPRRSGTPSSRASTACSTRSSGLGCEPKVKDAGAAQVVEGATNAKLPPIDVPPPGRYPSYDGGVPPGPAGRHPERLRRLLPRPGRPDQRDEGGRRQGGQGEGEGGQAMTDLARAISAFRAARRRGVARPARWGSGSVDLEHLLEFDRADLRRGDAGDPAGARLWVPAAGGDVPRRAPAVAATTPDGEHVSCCSRGCTRSTRG